MFKKLKAWYLARLEKKYNDQTIVVPKADFKYPPPSSYEVKQIKEEYKLDSRGMR